MHQIRFTLIVISGAILILLPKAPAVVAQQEARRYPGELEALNVSYRQQLREIERRWIADLADLADRSSDLQANFVYRQLFNLAIARDLCVEATPAARNCLASIPAGQDVRALAASVQVFARAEKGEYEQSLADFEALFKEIGCVGRPNDKSHAATGLAVGEAYLERLIRNGRYDFARRLCELACKVNAPAALKNHFETWMTRLDLMGKPAPVIFGTGVNGHPVSLADLSGKVVLVDFRGSRSPQCVASINALDALAQKYHSHGFVILGVNLDAKDSCVKDAKTASPAARQFLVRDGVTPISLVDCQSTDDILTAYGVEEIPANFLINRNGTIVAVEQSGDALERAIVLALCGLHGSDFK